MHYAGKADMLKSWPYGHVTESCMDLMQWPWNDNVASYAVILYDLEKVPAAAAPASTVVMIDHEGNCSRCFFKFVFLV